MPVIYFAVIALLNSFGVSASEAMEGGLSELTREIAEVEHVVQTKLREIPPDTTRVLLLGATGSGKSTLLHALVDQPLIVSITPPPVKLVAKNSLPGFAIGHTADSETLIPGLLYDQSNKVVYCDCPGFFDNRGEDQEIVNSFAIDQLLTAPSRVKILLVMSVHEIMAARGDSAKEQFQRIEQLVPSLEVLRPGIAIVITKANHMTNIQHLLALLATAKRKVSPLLNSFLKNPSNIFNFPNPIHEQEKELYNSFIDKEMIIRFLHDAESTLINPLHGIALSSKSIVRVLQIADGFGNIKSLLRSLISKLSEKFRHEKLSDLHKWKENILRLKDDVPVFPVDFVRKASLIIPYPEEYADIFEKIRRFQPLRNFLDRIFSSAVEQGELDEIQVANIKEGAFFQFVFADIPSNFIPLADDCLGELDVLIKATEEHERGLAELQKKHEEELANMKLVNDNLEEKVDAMRLDSEKKREEMQKLQEEFAEAQRQSEEKFQRELKEQMEASTQKLKELEDSLERERREKENRISSLESDLAREWRLSSDLESVTRERDKMQKKLDTIKEVTSDCYSCRGKVERIIEEREDGCTIL